MDNRKTLETLSIRTENYICAIKLDSFFWSHSLTNVSIVPRGKSGVLVVPKEELWWNLSLFKGD